MSKDKKKDYLRTRLWGNIVFILFAIGFVVAISAISCMAIKYHAKCIQVEKQYLSDGYHIADITIDGYTSRSYAIAH